MDEGDQMPASSHSRCFVDEPDALRSKVLESCFEGRHGEGNVVKPWPSSVEEPADRRARSRWLNELNVRAPDRKHRLLDSLGCHDLPVQHVDAVLPAVLAYRLIEVLDGDGNMVEVQ